MAQLQGVMYGGLGDGVWIERFLGGASGSSLGPPPWFRSLNDFRTLRAPHLHMSVKFDK